MGQKKGLTSKHLRSQLQAFQTSSFEARFLNFSFMNSKNMMKSQIKNSNSTKKHLKLPRLHCTIPRVLIGCRSSVRFGKIQRNPAIETPLRTLKPLPVKVHRANPLFGTTLNTCGGRGTGCKPVGFHPYHLFGSFPRVTIVRPSLILLCFSFQGIVEHASNGMPRLLLGSPSFKSLQCLHGY